VCAYATVGIERRRTSWRRAPTASGLSRQTRSRPSGRSTVGAGAHRNLEELVGVAREYDAAAQEPSLSGFLQEISLYSDQDALRSDEDDGGR